MNLIKSYEMKSYKWSSSHYSNTRTGFLLVSQEKVDCITVNCDPVKTTIDDLIQRLFDLLLFSLKKSIQGAHTHISLQSFHLLHFCLQDFCSFFLLYYKAKGNPL